MRTRRIALTVSETGLCPVCVNPFDPNDVGTEECSSCGWEHPDPDMDREVDDAMDEEG